MRKTALIGLLWLVFASCAERAEKREAPEASAPAASAASVEAPKPPAPPSEAVADAGKSEAVVVLAGGDVSLGRGAGKRIIDDPSYDPFHAIAPLLRTADLRFVNLESQLSEQKGETVSARNWLVFTGPPGGADVLARAGIDVVSVANNHAWDYGKSAFFETLDNLERAHVAYTGARREPDHAYEPTLIQVKGWRIAFFGVTQIWNQGPIQEHEGRHYVAWAAFDLLKSALEKARRENDLVFVSYHGGGEYLDVPMGWTREFIGAVMRAGADAVFGHHPHVPHGVAWYAGKPAFYSLGNFVFAMHSDYPWTGTSFMARLTFHADGRLEAEACPYFIFGHTPTPFEGKTKVPRERAFTQHFRTTSLSVGGSDIAASGADGCMPIAPPKERK